MYRNNIEGREKERREKRFALGLYLFFIVAQKIHDRGSIMLFCVENAVCRGERFAEVSVTSREQIARLGHSFVRDGTVVLTHGYSRCALHLLLTAAETKVRIGRPDQAGPAGRGGAGRSGVRRIPPRICISLVSSAYRDCTQPLHYGGT